MDKIFISYSHKDEDWKDRVQTHLTVLEKNGKLNIWDDRQIPLGGDWLADIEQSLEQASIALLLISRHFLSSDFILGKEIPELLKRRKESGLLVIPVMLTPCSWDHVDWLKEIQGYPRDNKPLSGMTEHQVDEALAALSSHLPNLGTDKDFNALTSPDTQKVHKQVTEASNVVINNISGITLEQYEDGLLRQEKRLREEFRSALSKQDSSAENTLTVELNAVQNKLLNLQGSYKEMQNHLREADNALDQLKNELPPAQVKAARKLLAKNDTQAAKLAFNDIVEKGTPSMALAAYESGKLEMEDANYKQAMKLYCVAVALEENNPDYLSAAGNMARSLGDYPAALKWLESLKKARLQSSSKNLELAFLQHDLGQLYKDLGEYKKSCTLYFDSLSIKESLLDKNHSSIASTLNNLAVLFRTQQEYAKAESLYKRTLSIYENSLSKDHPYIASTLNNLAELYRAQRQYTKANPLYQRALSIQENSLGKNHIIVATTLNNLASLYCNLGKPLEAESLYQRALIIQENSISKNHPDFAATLNNLAVLFNQQNRLPEAIDHMQRAIDIREKRLPSNHPNLIASKEDLEFLKGQLTITQI